MNIRSIDLQVMIPKTTEVSKIQQLQDQRSATQQQQFAEEWQHLAAIRQQQVQGTLKSEQKNIHRDDDRHGKEEHREERGDTRGEAHQETADSKDPFRGKKIDIIT